MLLMIIRYVALVVFGLVLGSFVNALVWRIHEQSLRVERTAKAPKKPAAKQKTVKRLKFNLVIQSKLRLFCKNTDELSVLRGRSMCPHCRHTLAPKDLVPVFSWLMLRGKCRYCTKPIAWQYPLVEVATALLFALNYKFWPASLHGAHIAIFVLWLLELIGFMALVVYDLRWLLLPNRIIYPLGALALAQVIIALFLNQRPWHVLLNVVLAVAVGGGIFYLLFQVSKGNWIGGGDVKLGWLLGLTAGTAIQSMLIIFLAAIGGMLFAIPLMATGKLGKKSIIPFGPFLLLGAVIGRLFGAEIIDWYQHLLQFGG